MKHLSELKYINAVLRETLRLTPTAPAFLRGTRPESKELHPSIGGGKFAMPEKGGMVCLLTKIQKDPKVWGDDAEEFKPERMLGDKFDALPANAWKPFGTGMRACIGRAFAWQEALLVVALILQNFDMRMDDPNYELRIVQTLTIKPKDFFMRATLRPGLTATGLQERLLGSVGTAEVGGGSRYTDKEQDTKSKVDLQILYGSNTGTCEALARKLASQAGQHGFSASVQELDAVIEQVSTTMPTAIITASYEGQPCDNAARFVAWMQSLQDPTAMKGVKYAVFGVGHSDWHSTYQHIPGLIDQKLSELGATRTAARGQTDVSKNNLFADFEDWAENVFWPSLPKPEGLPEFAPSLLVKGTIKTDVKHENRAAALQQHLQWAKVLDVKQLTAPGLPQKRHIEIELPEGMSYQVGDYLAVLPLNPKETVKRVMKRFWLGTDSMITIEDAGPTTLPVGLPLHVDDLLKGYVELSQPATLRVSDLIPNLHTRSTSNAPTGYPQARRARSRSIRQAKTRRHRKCHHLRSHHPPTPHQHPRPPPRIPQHRHLLRSIPNHAPTPPTATLLHLLLLPRTAKVLLPHLLRHQRTHALRPRRQVPRRHGNVFAGYQERR